MHDIHIHTSLSACARPDSSLAEYLPQIRARNLTIAGFSNHLWDSAVPGASKWYRPQDIEHLLQLKQELEGVRLPGVRMLFGCETEYIGGGVISLHPDHAGLFDFVLVAPNHFHMKDFVRPASVDGGEPLAELFYSRFMEVCEFDFVTGIAHPFFPFGFSGREREVMALFTEERLASCFRHANACHKTIEVNFSCLRKLEAVNGLDDYRRIMRIAVECGCRFHAGSDAHGICMFGEDVFARGASFAADCGITFAEDPLAAWP